MGILFEFCPKCGQRLSGQKIGGELLPVCTSKQCGFIFWQNSKPCASILIARADRHVLMGRRAINPDIGKLDLPGGFLRLGEHPFDGARREAKEELGVDIEIVRTFGFVVDRYGNDGDWTLNIGIEAKIVAGEIKAADDVASVEWVNPQTVRAEDLAFQNNLEFLRMWR